jgi:hypothetical protein
MLGLEMLKDCLAKCCWVCPEQTKKRCEMPSFFLGTIKDREVRINLVASGLTEIQNRANQLTGMGWIPNATDD